MPLPIIAIVGRPNVGKSTLFNRIIKRQDAVVDPTPGVTRDRHYAESDWDGVRFTLVDTGGWTPDGEGDALATAVREQTRIAAEEADIALLVCDAQAGPSNDERDLARILLKSGRPTIVVANKIDDVTRQGLAWEIPNYGLGDPLAASGRTGYMVAELLDVVVAKLRELKPVQPSVPAPEVLSLAIIGAPNSGKSSLVNRLAGKTRMVVSDIPGTTRDSVDTYIHYSGQTIRLVDTAGLRKRRLGEQGLDFYCTLRALRAIENCNVAVVLVDVEKGITQGDIRLAQTAADTGAGVIVAVNKWDKLTASAGSEEVQSSPEGLADMWLKEWKRRAPRLNWLPMLFISAVTGRRAVNVIEEALKVKAERLRRIPTSELNESIVPMLQRTPPPSIKGRMVRIKYAAQIDSTPPTFAIFASHAATVGDAYLRFTERIIRERYGFRGVPIRVQFRNK